MKRGLALAIILVLALAVGGVQRTAHAQTVFNFRGHLAIAFFSGIDQSGCVATDAVVFAAEDAFGTQGAPPTFERLAGVSIVRTDFCTGSFLLATGSADLSEPEFQIQGNLGSATLDTTILMTDAFSGTTFNADVDVTWTGVGELDHEAGGSHFEGPGIISNTHANNASRGAVAAGTVSDGSTNLIPSPSVSASMVSAMNGTVTVD